MSKPQPKPFILVDGSSYLFRAYHALPPLTTSNGHPTGAMVGVLNMLKKLINTYQPTHMVVVFDTKEKNFRHQMFEAYKANRNVMPDELAIQINPLYKIIQAMGLPLLTVPGVEADDVIGTLAVQATAQGFETIISTSDKDMAQLVNDNILLINTMTDTRLDIPGVIDKFQVRPDQIIDYLSLIGDSVDNIPGVPKVGPKTAAKWLQTYGNLESIIQHADEIKGKVGENLRDSLNELELYKTLIAIKTDVDLSVSPKDLMIKTEEETELKKLLTAFEFKKWLNEMSTSQTAPQAIERRYETILEKKAFLKWKQAIQNAKYFALDIESTALDDMIAEVVGISLAVVPGQAAYIPLTHDYEGAPKQLSKTWVLDELKLILENPKALKVGHNLKYDAKVLANEGITLRGMMFDSMLESYVLNSVASRHDLDTLALSVLNIKTTTFEEVAGKGIKQLTFNQIPLGQAAPYAAEDADITLQLHENFWQKLSQNKKLQYVYEKIEQPLIEVLIHMERVGVLIDEKQLHKQSQILSERLDRLQKEAESEANCEFNLNSPKQLQEILFEQQGLPIIEKTPKGQPSTSEAVLQELAMDYTLPKIILEYRSLSKLKSTYADKLPQKIHSITKRVHSSFHQTVTATGRLSSTDPNLQNIPIKTPEGRKIRSAFIAPEGYQILSADYSQIELRIMAHISGDDDLLGTFARGEDIHLATAAEIFSVPLSEVTQEQRRHAKAINFGLLYGMSGFGLGKQLGIERREAEIYIEQYFKQFPKVKNYIKTTKAFARENGFVETLFGRRLYLPDINSKHIPRRKAAERAAINAPMQGAQADIIKLAMIEVHHWLQAQKFCSKMILQVHDELVFEVKNEEINKVKDNIVRIMSNIVALDVPLVVGVGIGSNWDEAH